MQRVEYLPFGETFIDERTASPGLPYKFNAKELDEETGLYYYGARYYDPNLSLWLSVDPLAEKYPNISSYAYCANNPVKFVDPDGRKIVIVGSAEYKKAAFNDLQKLSSNNLVMLKNGQVVEASGYKRAKSNILHSGTGTGKKDYGTKLIESLINNKHTVTVRQSTDENNSFTPTSMKNAQTSGVGSGGILLYDLETTGYNVVNEDKTSRAPAFIFLGHELDHANRSVQGKTLDVNKKNGKIDPDSPSNWSWKIHPEEIQTRKNENIIRKENNVKLRANP